MTKNRTIQIYRGTTAQNDAYTGFAGELTMDTTTNELRLHDGSTVGGHIIGLGGGSSPYIIDKQEPTAENNYTWYRKWSDGWVEQGGDDLVGNVGQNVGVSKTVTLPLAMADTNYCAIPTARHDTAPNRFLSATGERTTTTVTFGIRNVSSASTNVYVSWIVCGLAAS